MMTADRVETDRTGSDLTETDRIKALSVSEYIEDFTERATELSRTKLDAVPMVDGELDYTGINNHVQDLIDEYYSKVGKYPKPFVLDLLANYILVNELKDAHVDKVANNDFPILSDTQLRRRERKQFTAEDTTLDFLNTKYNKHVDSLAKKSVKQAEY